MARVSLCQYQQPPDSLRPIRVTLKRDCVVLVEHGLTMLRCSRLMKSFEDFDGTITITNGTIKADGRSMIDLLQLRAKQGAVLTIHMTGIDPDRLLLQVKSILSDSANQSTHP